MSNVLIPNLFIIRVPDYENQKWFLQFPIDEESHVKLDEIVNFHVEDEDDDYNSLGFDQVVLAYSEDGESSYELDRATVTDENGNPVNVYSDPSKAYEVFGSLLQQYIDAYQNVTLH